MSRIHASTALLAAAARQLRRELMPGLDGEARVSAAMIARAIEIGAREVELGAGLMEQERRALVGFYGAPESAPRTALLRRLVADLRKDTLAEGQEERLRNLLEARIRGRLQVSNPDYSAD